MNNSIKAEDQTKEISQIRENYEDGYWAKKYGVSTEEIKSHGYKKDLSERIVEAAFKKEKLKVAAL